MSNPYSNLKMPWHYVRDGGLPDAPKQVQVVLSDLCNQNCSFCAYRLDGYSSNQLFATGDLASYGHNNPKRFMPTERARLLLQEMKDAGVEAVQFTGGGEPTVHPDHLEIMNYAILGGFECALVSNGLKWSEGLTELLTAFSWVRVSLDAGTPETYSKIRDTAEANYEKVLDNVSRLARAIDEADSRCVLGIGFVVTPENYKEIVHCVEAAEDCGAHNIRISAMFSPDGAWPFAGIYDYVKDAILRAKDAVTDLEVIDNFGERIDDLELENPDYPICAKMHYCSYVGADLQLYACCVYSYNERGKVAGDLGSLKDRKFDEFWASPERKKWMADFNPKACERCQFNSANRAMNYIMGGKPTHSEFP